MALELSRDPHAHCTFVRQFDHELSWYPERDYVAGSQVELRVGRLRSFLSWRYVAMSMPAGDVDFRWKVNPSISELRTNPNRVLLRARLAYGARQGERKVFHLRMIPPTWAGVDLQLGVWTLAPSDAWQADAQPPPAEQEPGSTAVCPVVAGPVERLGLYATPVADAEGNTRVVVSPQDRFGNPARFRKPVQATVRLAGHCREVALSETLELHLACAPTVARPAASIPMDSLAPEENIGNGTVEEGGRLVVGGNPVADGAWEDLLPAFGEFHWHTQHSGDGQRPIREALRCARDELNLDYAAPGDHNTSGEAWRDTVAALDEFENPGRFATFFGWEASSRQGHENLYFTDPDHPLVCRGTAGFSGGKPHENVATLRQYSDFLAIPHHANAVAETRRLADDAPFWHPYSWTEPTDAHRLVEIFQTRGNQERNDYTDAWHGWHQGNGASVQDALAKGYRLGFVGGTDNHCGWPGRAFGRCEGMGMHPPHTQSLTGVWTGAIERQAVYDGLASRHAWAVWNTRALVWFGINGALMGDGLTWAPGQELTARIRICAEAPFQTVELVSERQTLWQQSFSATEIDTSVAVPPPAADTHVYLRALLRNGGMLYASPVFIDVKEPTNE
jgi:hypothetical protein